jgi:nitroreductase
MTKYGYKGYAYALLDCGIMTELLYAEANRLGAGCCSIGDMDHGKVEEMLGLPSKSVILHTIEIGCK